MTDGSLNTPQTTYPVRLVRNHSFSPNRIRQLIKDSLTPLPTDPIPDTVVIKNIIITQISQSDLEIECEVYYAY